MGNLADYFSKNRYQPRWLIGDRVRGTYNKIPFVGTVGNDTVISEIEGARVSVHLDLPLMEAGFPRTIIFVKPNSLKEFKWIDSDRRTCLLEV